MRFAADGTIMGVRPRLTRRMRIEPEGNAMSIVKVIEVIASSDKGWEDAAQNAVTEAGKTVKNIKQFNVVSHSAVVDSQGKIQEYRVNGKISFVVGD